MLMLALVLVLVRLLFVDDLLFYNDGPRGGTDVPLYDDHSRGGTFYDDDRSGGTDLLYVYGLRGGVDVLLNINGLRGRIDVLLDDDRPRGRRADANNRCAVTRAAPQ
ncbi:MAG: hypothetical protein ACXWCY_12675 [Burkholderiales bacterium]